MKGDFIQRQEVEEHRFIIKHCRSRLNTLYRKCANNVKLVVDIWICRSHYLFLFSISNILEKTKTLLEPR